MIGKKYHRLMVMQKTSSGPSHHKRFICICECGSKVTVIKSKILTGHTKSCGCWNKEQTIIANKARKGIFRRSTKDYALRLIMASLKGNAKSRGLKICLSSLEFCSLIYGACHYCGDEKTNKVTIKHRDCTFYYNGIDRLNSDLGYTFSNCVSCCFRCNRAKDIMSYSEFISHIRKIYNTTNKFGEK